MSSRQASVYYVNMIDKALNRAHIYKTLPGLWFGLNAITGKEVVLKHDGEKYYQVTATNWRELL